jgi:hypothetical protein
MRSDVLMAVNIQIIVLCSITQCSLVDRYKLCNNKTKHPYMTRYYSNQKAIHFSCTSQPSSSFTFQKYKKEIHIAVALHTRVKTWLPNAAETCSFLDYYSKVLCMNGLSYFYILY